MISKNFNAIMAGGDFTFHAPTTIHRRRSWQCCHISAGTNIISMLGHTHLAMMTLDVGPEHPDAILINLAWCLLRGSYHLCGGPTTIWQQTTPLQVKLQGLIEAPKYTSADIT